MAAKKDEAAEVVITRTLTVSPAPSLLPHEPYNKLIRLSNLDTKCPDLMYLVFFYRSPPPPPPAAEAFGGHHLFSSLKRGLEEAMAEWYPAAGRLCLSGRRLALTCNSAGALLLEAATRTRISDLGDDLSQHNDFFERLVFRPPPGAGLEDVPLVVAQVTRFSCGGCSIGVGTNHAVFDGAANYEFLSAWAAKTVGRRAAAPVHERGRLLLQNSRSASSSAAAPPLRRPLGEEAEEGGGGGCGGAVLALEHLQQMIKQAAMVAYVEEEELVLRTFSVGRGMVSRLKSKATAGSPATSGGGSSFSCSSFEVVAAHLWKARTKALNIAKDRMVCLQFSVDARPRMDPPLPKSFSGNAYVLSSVACTAAELERHTLAAVVAMINEAKRAVTDDYVIRYIAALEAAAAAPIRSAATALPPLPELTMVSDWTKMPYHKIDFVGAGEAACVTPLPSPLPQVAYFMQSPREAGRVDVRIGLPRKNLQAFTHCFSAL